MPLCWLHSDTLVISILRDDDYLQSKATVTSPFPTLVTRAYNTKYQRYCFIAVTVPH